MPSPYAVSKIGTPQLRSVATASRKASTAAHGEGMLHPALVFMQHAFPFFFFFSFSFIIQRLSMAQTTRVRQKSGTCW